MKTLDLVSVLILVFVEVIISLYSFAVIAVGCEVLILVFVEVIISSLLKVTVVQRIVGS